jgi:hypothetical protein
MRGIRRQAQPTKPPPKRRACSQSLTGQEPPVTNATQIAAKQSLANTQDMASRAYLLSVPERVIGSALTVNSRTA